MITHDARFGPEAQTPQQRAQVLHQMRSTLPQLFKSGSASAEHVYARYVAGELSWLQVRQQLDTASGTKGRGC